MKKLIILWLIVAIISYLNVIILGYDFLNWQFYPITIIEAILIVFIVHKLRNKVIL